MVAPAAVFTVKPEFVFVFNKTLFLIGFTLKSTERALLLIKKRTRDFQNSPPFER